MASYNYYIFLVLTCTCFSRLALAKPVFSQVRKEREREEKRERGEKRERREEKREERDSHACVHVHT